jgi:hypothetical protein
MARYWRTIDFPSDSRHRRAAVRAQACADRRPGFAEVAAAHALRHAEAPIVLIHWRKHHTVPSALGAINFTTINRFAREFRG